MAQNYYTHTDNDGDKLEVLQGLQGAVVRGTDKEEGHFTEVAVHAADLPRLIASLQAIHDELEGLS